MIIPGSDVTIDSPNYTGTPEDWFEQATELTRLQAANRREDCWYISITSGGYMLHRASEKSNPARLAALDKVIQRRGLDTDAFYREIDPEIRLLVSVNATPPAWIEEELLMADTAPGSNERALWASTPKRLYWRRITDGRLRVTTVEMAELNPSPVIVREVDAPE